MSRNMKDCQRGTPFSESCVPNEPEFLLYGAECQVASSRTQLVLNTVRGQTDGQKERWIDGWIRKG